MLLKQTIIKSNSIDMKEYLEKFHDENKFLGFCKQCHNYAKFWSCPSYDFSTYEYMSAFKYLNVFASKVYLDNESLIKEKVDNKIIYGILNDVRRKYDDYLVKIEEKYKNSKALYAGSCIICDKCTRLENKPCKHRDLMRYSLESLGCDVQGTADKLLDIKILWSSDSLPEYFTLVFGFMTNDIMDKQDIDNFYNI